MSELTERAKILSQVKKERYLAMLSETDFCDRVIRPLFRRKDFSDGRDVCGPLEEGKDVIFVKKDPFGILDIYAVQTKKGNLNMSSKVAENVVTAATQLKTALDTKITLLHTKEKKLPTKVFLCVSGKINERAKEYICDQMASPAIGFMDANILIPQIDELIPEFWFDIDSDILPYLRAFKKHIETQSRLFTKTELMAAEIAPIAASENLFISLRLHRFVMRPRKRRGRVEQVPVIEEFPVTALQAKAHRLVLILGSAGMGKTTSLLRLAFLMTEKAVKETEGIKIPVLLRASEIAANKEITILEICAQKTMEISNSRKPAFSAKDIENGNITVFVDALDEVPNLVEQKSIVHKLLEFNKLYPKCQIILTSREYAFIDDIPELISFAQFNLTPINYKQAEKILLGLHKTESLPIEKSSELLRRLQDVHGIELNPLLVTVFAATTDYSRSDIPANITELFKKFTELMLGRWDASKGLSLQYQAPLKDFVLQKITFEMHRRRVTFLPLSEFKSLARTELETRGHKADFEQLTEEMLYRSGLFRVINEMVEFRHLMLQEFFAGRGIPNVETMATYIYDDWWRRAIVFFFGDRPEETEPFSFLTSEIPSKTSPEIFNALITMGLSLQACYLVKVSKKLPVFGWIIKKLSDIQKDYERDVVVDSKYPLRDFLNYYIYARDSVANSVLPDHLKDVLDICHDDNPDAISEEIRRFWIIIGLIEIGELGKAEALVQKFHPSDPRLLLGIHLGCSLIQHTRVTNKHDKALAQKICERIDESIASLRQKVIEEFKSELLEIRKDKLLPLEKSENA